MQRERVLQVPSGPYSRQDRDGTFLRDVGVLEARRSLCLDHGSPSHVESCWMICHWIPSPELRRIVAGVLAGPSWQHRPFGGTGLALRGSGALGF